MIKWSFKKREYGSYPQNADFDDLPIEYKQRVFTKWPLYCLTDNIIETLKVSSIEWLLDNRLYKSNPRNYDLYDLTFDGDKRLISGRQLYRINDDIAFRLNNGLRVYVYTNWM